MKKCGYTNGMLAQLCNTTENKIKHSCKKLKVSGYIGIILKNNKRRHPWNKGKTYKIPNENLIKVRIESVSDNPRKDSGNLSIENKSVVLIITQVPTDRIPTHNRDRAYVIIRTPFYKYFLFPAFGMSIQRLS